MSGYNWQAGLPASGTPVVNDTGRRQTVKVLGGAILTTAVVPLTSGALTGASTPGVAASGTPVTNSTGGGVLAQISGGTVSNITVGGTTVGAATGLTVWVPSGSTITLTYSSAPTWVWYAALNGFSVNLGTSSMSVSGMPPGNGNGAVVFYTGSPTWSWTQMEDFSGQPVQSPQSGPPVAAAGLSDSAPSMSVAELIYLAHATGGEAGLAVAVAN